MLVHEVYCAQGARSGPADFRRYHASHHTSGVELAALAERARPRLLILQHVLFFGCTPEQVLSEVMEVFPGPWIHVGADEVPKTRWRACQRCQERMRMRYAAG